MNARKKIIIAAFFLILCGTLLNAESDISREYVIKTATLYNILKFIEWPTDTFENENSPLQLAIIGDDPLGKALGSIEGKSVKGHPLAVTYHEDASSVGLSHAVFVTQNQRDNVAQILQQLEGKPVLTVADLRSFAKQGGMINFFIENNKIRFEINANQVYASELKVSSNLMKLGRIVSTQNNKGGLP